ncbi:MAG: transporter [Nevskiales bacterium]
MVVRRIVCALTVAGASGAAGAGIVFTPHLSEYSALPRGQYTEFTYINTAIDETFNRSGDKQPLGFGAVPPGESIEASLFLLKYLWIGNPFRDTELPYLKNHDLLFRAIGTVGDQQATGELNDLSRRFGLRSGGSGFGDLFLLGGIYGPSWRLGAMHLNTLFALTYKLPVGDYENDRLLNPGTNYDAVIPQFAFHQNWYGRLFVDGTLAYQKNGRNDDPGFGGLVPSHAADLYNAEINFAWKFSEKWFADLGVSHRSTRGEGNEFANPSLNIVDQPVEPTQLCDQLNLGALGLGDLTGGLLPNCPGRLFFIRPRPGVYEDGGIRATLATAGFYYVYRSSAVLNFRIAYPVSGKGSQFDLPYDVTLGLPTGPGGSFEPSGIPVSSTVVRVNGVQEAAAVSASPYLELRFVYLFWAP